MYLETKTRKNDKVNDYKIKKDTPYIIKVKLTTVLPSAAVIILLEIAKPSYL